MKKLLSFLFLFVILFVFQAKLYAVPKYLVIDLQTQEKRYTDDAPDLSSDVCRTTELWLRYIPAGTFMMGSPVGENGRENPSDETQHRVTLSQPYYIGVFEVTQAQWEAIMNFGAPIVWGGGIIPTRPSYFKNDEHYATRPVESVSYYMIRGEEAGIGWPNSDEVDDYSFLGILRELTGLIFDLPTEAQWEYACRAGKSTALNSGKNLINSYNEDANMNAVGRYMHNSGYYNGFFNDEGNRELSVDEFGTAKVGSYAPNEWGLYDMHGNVVEWCLDWFYGDDYSTDDVTDPVGEEFDPDLEVSVCRGGSWCSEPYKCRSAFRGISNSYADDYENGFRVVCPAPNQDIPKYAVTVTNGSANKTTAYAGETITITANTPAAHKLFDTWTTTSGVTFANAKASQTTFTMPAKAVTVTATYKDEPKYDVTGVALSAPQASLNLGRTLKLTATVSPANAADKTLTWKTDNDKVATVSADGVVTAVGEGSCTITVTATNGTAAVTTDDKSATCTVTVGNPEYNLTLKTGTAYDGENAKWTITPQKAKFGQEVKLQYSGSMRVKQVRLKQKSSSGN